MAKNKNLNDLIGSLDYIDVEINATHLNYVNDNAVLYTVDAATEGGKSWLTPFGRPQLLHHDKHRDAVGRVIDYSIEDSSDMKGEPKDFIKLTVRITDKDAMEKVANGIYYTCSVGSSTSKLRCSHCDQVITTDGLCEHQKGTMVDGKKVYWIVDNISYKENSFVNNPADSFSRITSIDIGDGPMAYDKFLSDKESILTNFFMEDNMKKEKLTAEQREKLSDSTFCGPGRSFPAHDEEHIKAGLALLVDSKFEDETKQKIKASLYRKGKRFDIAPTEDELKDNADLLLFRMDDEFSEDEIKAIKEFFDENPDSDLPKETEENNDDSNDTPDEKVYTIDDYEEIKKAKKDDILAFCDFLFNTIKEQNDKIETLNKEIKDLSDASSEQETILNSKEDEISKLLDDNAVLSSSYRKALVDNVLDVKKVIENRDEESKKFDGRKIDSLLDTLSDLRTESFDSIPEVKDETLINNNSDNSDENNSDDVNLNDSKEPADKVSRYFKRDITEE